jgi:hypothetical protein
MRSATFRFYAELNDFLPQEKRMRAFPVELAGHETVKHLIEMLGVPHPEVDLILVNGQSVDFDYLVRGGDRVSVYPVFESVDIRGISKVRPEPLRSPRFVLDSHLGRLAGYLRLLGFDCLYRNDFQDRELAEISARQERILLTRDRGLLKRKIVTRGYLVRSDQPLKQAEEIIRRFDLASSVRPFTRCSRCNGRLVSVEKSQVFDQLEPLTKKHYNQFTHCEDCGQVYWRGSHFQELEEKILGLIPGLPS